MSDLTIEKAAELRRPFPPDQIGKLPKGGQMLDFVGHAATTDRLLQVDPEWSWEPLALDERGLPAIDKSGNLWIRLTILGVTRLGVGDGPSAKVQIGDAIRNAAMRFGVALDLWAKEDLEGASPWATAAPAPKARLAAALRPAEPTTPPAPLTDRTRGALFAELTKHGITDEGVQRAGMSRILGREITSRSELTEADANAVIADLKARS